ncbi:MAG: hypothetical protein OXE94_12760 [Aestuariivita sp.]|nr:hypothetical protein [Aestuariivita sp.]MCY4202500.1 hypothetical protein [Aestuariivita sp.]
MKQIVTVMELLIQCRQIFRKWPPQKLVLLVNRLFAAVFAWKRYAGAGSELRHKQFRQAANLLGDQSISKNFYLGRTASVAILSFLAKNDRKTGSVAVMRRFKAFFAFFNLPRTFSMANAIPHWVKVGAGYRREYLKI